MIKKYKLGAVVIGVAAVAAVAAAVIPAALVDSSHHAAATARPAQAKYGDYDVIDAVVFSQGRIVDDHPGLKAKLLNSSVQPLDPEPRQKFEQFVLQRNPDFHDVVTVPLQSGDPYAAQQALRTLSTKVTEAVDAPQRDNAAVLGNTSLSQGVRQGAVARAAGFAWHDSWLATEGYIAAVWAAAAVHTVGGAVTVAVALYVAPAVATYEFKVNSADDLTKNSMVAALASSLA
ncbi:hypothetical protein ABLE92_17845 [Gordonia sp. VNQ95]|uniref:hypothetical protein n=1 Tax=Gordonia sp. VNQ95 TaxID=3156619 RepID=UPI0032B55500